jgi:hypothetical protein
MEKKWREQNEAILSAHPQTAEPAAEPAALSAPPEGPPVLEADRSGQAEPQLPLPPP